jgi:elongation factor 3
MAAPTSVPNTIKSLSNTTFVSEVTSPSLAILVPLLSRALADRSMDTQRRTVVVIENVCKLVRDPSVAARYLSPLVEGVDRIATGASFPEVREFASSALKTLLAAGASKEAKPAEPRDIPLQTSAAIKMITPLLPQYLFITSPNGANIPPMPAHPLFNRSLQFIGRLVADLVEDKQFVSSNDWNTAIGVYLAPWLQGDSSDQKSESEKIAEEVRVKFWEAEKVRSYLHSL